MGLTSTNSAIPWPPQPPNGWSLPAFALGAFWYLRQGLTAKGRLLLVPQAVVVVLAAVNGLFLWRQTSLQMQEAVQAEQSLQTQGALDSPLLPAIVAALVLWSLVGSYCAASFRGDAYRRWCADNHLTPLVPTGWQWGAFLLTGGWYVGHGMRVKGLWLWLAFFTAVGSIVGIPLAFALMCYCGANFRAERFLDKPPARIGPTPQERWIHRDLLKALTPVAQTPQAALRASLIESAVRGLRRQGYRVRVSDDQDENAAALTLERGSRYLAARVAPEAPVPVGEVEELIEVLGDDDYKVGVLVVNGALTAAAQAAAAQAHVRVLNVQDAEP